VGTALRLRVRYKFSFSTANSRTVLIPSRRQPLISPIMPGPASSVSVTFFQFEVRGTRRAIRSLVWHNSPAIVAINSALLSSGKVLLWDGQSSYGTTGIVWNPATNTTEWVPPPANIFCSGQEQMADGRVLVVGRAYRHPCRFAGPRTSLNPRTRNRGLCCRNMAYHAGIPTATTTLPDGRVIVMSGETNCADMR